MWKEGAFITPQHLQVQDDFHQQELEERMRALNPNNWGVIELSIDSEQLMRGIFALTRLVAVMPDGSLIRVDDEHSLPAKQIRKYEDTKGESKRLGIFVAIPSQTSIGVARSQGSGGARYVETQARVNDIYGIAEDVDIACVYPNVQLLFEGDKLEGYISFKIAELILEGSSFAKLSQSYFPPMFQVGSSSALKAKISELVLSLSSKQSEMKDRYYDRKAAMVEFGSAEVSTLLYLHTVNYWIPIIRHYSTIGSCHPEELHLVLSTCLSQLSTFKAERRLPEFPRYDHNDLSHGLNVLFDELNHLLGTVAESSYELIELTQKQPGLFVGDLSDPSLFDKELYVVASGDIPEAILKDELPRYIKIGSFDQISHIVQAALPGVEAHVTNTVPSKIPMRQQLLYLAIVKDGKYWDAIPESGRIAIYQPVKPENIKLELMAVDKR